MSADQLAIDEPLSPELVLVLSPELRAQALAKLGPPVWPKPRLRVAAQPTPIHQPFALSLGEILLPRVVQLGVIFLAVTILTLALSVVAHAVRSDAIGRLPHAESRLLSRAPPGNASMIPLRGSIA